MVLVGQVVLKQHTKQGLDLPFLDRIPRETSKEEKEDSRRHVSETLQRMEERKRLRGSTHSHIERV